ncbi:MAG TPA: hypothetical protein VFQ35_11860, partial [Polyangiaceae bacterium]|nr:hypothetical protein [Polyangiaceae bacterium]
ICLESPEHTCWAAAGIIALSEGAVPDLPAFAERLIALGLDRAKVGAITRALVPYAASIDRAGAATPRTEADDATSPKPSFWKRLFG